MPSRTENTVDPRGTALVHLYLQAPPREERTVTLTIRTMQTSSASLPAEEHHLLLGALSCSWGSPPAPGDPLPLLGIPSTTLLLG